MTTPIIIQSQDGLPHPFPQAILLRVVVKCIFSKASDESETYFQLFFERAIMPLSVSTQKYANNSKKAKIFIILVQYLAFCVEFNKTLTSGCSIADPIMEDVLSNIEQEISYKSSYFICKSLPTRSIVIAEI